MRGQLLVVEDDRDSLEMVCMLLETSGFVAIGVGTPAAAAAELARRAFDLVLADFLLDTRDADESWRVVDDLVRRAHPTPVGLLTAWRVARAELGAHGLAFALAKPCSSEQLLAELGRVLDPAPLSEHLQARLRSYFARIERGDHEGVAALCTEDVRYHLPHSDPRFGTTVEGRAAFRDFTAATFQAFREPRFELRELRAMPRGAVVHYTGSWAGPDGQRQELAGAVLFGLRGDQICEIGIRLDLARLPAPH